MGIIDNLNLNIQKLFIRGRIDKVYERMYNVAESLAAHETKKMFEIIANNSKKKLPKDISPEDYYWNYATEVMEYRQKRIEHHINEMKELLKLREEFKK
jgi:hypothetical protein